MFPLVRGKHSDTELAILFKALLRQNSAKAHKTCKLKCNKLKADRATAASKRKAESTAPEKDEETENIIHLQYRC